MGKHIIHSCAKCGRGVRNGKYLRAIKDYTVDDKIHCLTCAKSRKAVKEIRGRAADQALQPQQVEPRQSLAEGTVAQGES